ncbi:flagellar biosynthetic protein FliQ [Endothiovibrio diazotrophicus]
MTPESVLAIFQQTIHLIALLLAMILLPSLVVGILISMFQAATQINEMTLTFIPKLLVTMAALSYFGPRMLQMLTEFFQGLIQNLLFVIQ